MVNDRLSFVKPNDRTSSRPNLCGRRREMADEPTRSRAPLDVIAAALRAERRRAGLSLGEVARKAGIAKSTLSQLESGAGNPSVETLWALSTALDMPLDRKSTRLNSSHVKTSHAVLCLKKKKR